jgi:hypothetical protein
MARYLFALSLLAATAGLAPLAAQEPEPPRFALLVGVSKYANLPPHQQLQGCVNDVKLMKQMLSERLKYQEKEITVLTDEKATAKDIRAALADLARRVKALPKDGPKVPVVFHFSGHGSQIADQAPGDSDHDEEDGLDETLVPHDATAQGGAEDIRDDETNRFVHDVCSHPRVRLWVILDCCHSGTGTRGAAEFRQLARGLKPSAPAKKPEFPPEVLARKTLPENCVVLAACLAEQVEPEYREGGTNYGLLTYFLVRTVYQAKDLSKLSYTELRARVAADYLLSAVLEAPTVVLEGSTKAVQAPLFGDLPQAPGAALWAIEPDPTDPGKATLSAGRVHGVTEDSLYELHATRADAEANKPPVALLRTRTVGALSTEVDVCRWSDKQKTFTDPDKLPKDFRGGAAREIQKGLPLHQFAVRVVTVDPATQRDRFLAPTSADVPGAVKTGLAQARGATERAWFLWAEKPEADADTLLRIDGDYAAYFSATGVATPPGVRDPKVPESLRGGWGPVRLSAPGAANELRELLRKIAKTRNLIRMATSFGQTEEKPLQVTVEVGRAKLNPSRSVASIEPLAPGAKLTAGDVYAYRITSKETKPVYVTLLGVNRNLGVELLHPAPDVGATTDDQKVGPRRTVYSDAFEVTKPLGARTVVILVTQTPTDFSYLLQEQLPQVQSTGARTADLTKELNRHLFFGPQRKVESLTAVRTEEDDRFAMRLLQWETAPPKPKAQK